MGYHTEFKGKFKITPPLKKEDRIFLSELSRTRRMARKVDKKYGVEGEFFVDGESDKKDHDYNAQKVTPDVLGYGNRPPRTQPTLWCPWTPSKDGKYLAWNKQEKPYGYILWINYLVAKILRPGGYTLSGSVTWRGEYPSDSGTIQVKENILVTYKGIERSEAGWVTDHKNYYGFSK